MRMRLHKYNVNTQTAYFQSSDISVHNNIVVIESDVTNDNQGNRLEKLTPNSKFLFRFVRIFIPTNICGIYDPLFVETANILKKHSLYLLRHK